MRKERPWIDILLIFICCMAVSVFCKDNADVIIMLIGVLFVSLSISSSSQQLFIVVNTVFCVFCVIFPPLVFYLPSILYNNVNSRNYTGIAMLAGTLFFDFCHYEYKGYAIVLILLLSLISAVMSERTSSLNSIERRLIEMRDNDVEAALQLRSKNKALLEKQDYEIYLATLKERNRIAREIHDNVGHLLSRSLLQTGALLAVTDKEKSPVQYEQTQALKDTLNSAMTSIRESVHGLRDDSIDLKNAIDEAVSEMKSRYLISVENDFSEKMPAKIKLCFIAIIKEALSNIVKHSNASKILISVREHPAIYQLIINDNGTVGTNASNSGMGLSNMTERVEALGGIIKIDNENGFKIFVSLRRENNDENSSSR